MQNRSNYSGQNRPEKKFVAGAVSATVWKNSSNMGAASSGMPENANYYTISLQRAYKDKSGNWKTSASLRANDLPKASLVLNKAYEYMVFKDSADSADSAV